MDNNLSVEWLLRPTGLKEFFNDYWERRPLILSRGDEGYFRHLLSLEDMDQVLSSHELRHPLIQLVKNNARVPPPQWTTEEEVKGAPVGTVADRVKMFGEYQNGATIILDHLHRTWPPLARLCASVERFFGHPTQTNVYLTPPGSKGFGAHYDTHDVFILQTEGSKRWQLYDSPMRLPLPSQTYPHPGPDPGKPTADFVLRAGDVLYMPRGVIHSASTSDSTSLHVTLGITAYTWADVLNEALTARCEGDVRFRRSLPVGFSTDADGAAEARAEARGLLRALAEGGLPLEEALGQLAERFLMSRPPLLAGHLTGLSSARRLTAQSRARKRAWLARLVEEGNGVHVLFHGKGMTFARQLVPTLRYILDTEVFTVASLPGPLKEADKVELTRRLIEEGLLMLAEEAS
jgi:ribosomal protein L16 Arg81 hydroxylase